jgi:hypothetical protein
MDTIKEIQDEQAKGIHSMFNACMYRDECRAKEAEAEQMRSALAELARYFTSGNSVPVERATILAMDFWRITGLTPNVRVTGDLREELAERADAARRPC